MRPLGRTADPALRYRSVKNLGAAITGFIAEHKPRRDLRPESAGAISRSIARFRRTTLENPCHTTKRTSSSGHSSIIGEFITRLYVDSTLRQDEESHHQKEFSNRYIL